MSVFRFLVLADTFGTMVRTALHNHREAVQACHAILLLGDLPAQTYPALRDEFKLTMPAFAVLGNHDGKDWDSWLPRYKIQHVHRALASLRVDGQEITLAGFSGSERYKPGAFWQWDDPMARRLLKDLPAADILLTHTSATPPPDYPADHKHRGLPPIGDYLQRHQPALALHGHFHHNYVCQQGGTQVIGCYGAVLLAWEAGAPIQMQEINVSLWST